MITIPVFQSASYIERVIIDDVIYFLSFKWSTRGEYWILDILDQDKNNLINGIKIVKGRNLLAPYQYKNIPQGFLMLVEPSDMESIIDKEDLGDVANLIYATEDEIASL